jgi:REP element-mobilizing transposase RayT
MAYRQPGRRSIRLPGRDYSRENAYFVTVSTVGKTCVLGDIVNGALMPSDSGRIIADEWAALGKRFAAVYLDAWVVMPNHLHGIVWLRPESAQQQGAQQRAPTRPGQPPGVPTGRKPLGQIVGAFKTAVMRRINQRDGTPGQTIWQRNYYERVVRDQAELNRIRTYIRENPWKWMGDPENPAQSGLPSPTPEDV